MNGVFEKGTKQEANVGTKIMANTLGLSCVVQQNRSSTKILAITHGTTTNTGRPRIVIYLTTEESGSFRQETAVALMTQSSDKQLKGRKDAFRICVRCDI